jgi:peptidoglycan/LPS O-acetylase OafA/YrhL
LLFSQNLFTPQVNFFPEAWSLAVEEWFYLITPIMLWLFYKIFRKVLIKKWIFLLVIFTVLLISIVFRYQVSTSLTGKIAEWDAHVRRVVFMRLDSIMYGVLGAFLKFYFPALWKKKSLFPYLNLLGIVCLFVAHYAYLGAINNNTTIFMNTLYFSISGIGVMFLLPQIDSLKVPPQYGIMGIMGKIVTHISLISYSLYLTHGYLILGHFIRYKNEYFDKQLPHSPLVGVLYFISYLLVSVIISTILYYTIEITFMNMRTKEINIVKLELKNKIQISSFNKHITH